MLALKESIRAIGRSLSHFHDPELFVQAQARTISGWCSASLAPSYRSDITHEHSTKLLPPGRAWWQAAHSVAGRATSIWIPFAGTFLEQSQDGDPPSASATQSEPRDSPLRLARHAPCPRGGGLVGHPPGDTLWQIECSPWSLSQCKSGRRNRLANRKPSLKYAEQSSRLVAGPQAFARDFGERFRRNNRGRIGRVNR